MKSLSRVQPSATPWTAAHEAPPSMGFSRQEYWSGVPLPSLMKSLEGFKTVSWFMCLFSLVVLAALGLHCPVGLL